MLFVPIKLSHYARLHLEANRGDKEPEVVEQLQSALAAYKAGERCSCGEPIWVIGSSQSRAYVFHLHHRRGSTRQRLRDR